MIPEAEWRIGGFVVKFFHFAHLHEFPANRAVAAQAGGRPTVKASHTSAKMALARCRDRFPGRHVSEVS